MVNKNSKLMMLMALAATSINATTNIDAEGVAALLEAEREEAAKLEAEQNSRYSKARKAAIAGAAVVAGVMGAVVARKALRKSPTKPSATETVALEASHPDSLTIDQSTPVAVKAPGEDVTGNVTLSAGKPDEEPKVEAPVVFGPETETLHLSVEAPAPVDSVLSQPTATPVKKSFRALVVELARKHERTVAATITALLTVGSLGTAYHLASTTTPSEMLPCDVPTYGPFNQEVASNLTGAVAQFVGPVQEIVVNNSTAIAATCIAALSPFIDFTKDTFCSATRFFDYTEVAENSTNITAPVATEVIPLLEGSKEPVAITIVHPVTNIGTSAELLLIANDVYPVVRPSVTDQAKEAIFQAALDRKARCKEFLKKQGYSDEEISNQGCVKLTAEPEQKPVSQEIFDIEFAAYVPESISKNTPIYVGVVLGLYRLIWERHPTIALAITGTTTAIQFCFYNCLKKCLKKSY